MQSVFEWETFQIFEGARVWAHHVMNGGFPDAETWLIVLGVDQRFVKLTWNSDLHKSPLRITFLELEIMQYEMK